MYSVIMVLLQPITSRCSICAENRGKLFILPEADKAIVQGEKRFDDFGQNLDVIVGMKNQEHCSGSATKRERVKHMAATNDYFH